MVTRTTTSDDGTIIHGSTSSNNYTFDGTYNGAYETYTTMPTNLGTDVYTLGGTYPHITLSPQVTNPKSGISVRASDGNMHDVGEIVDKVQALTERLNNLEKYCLMLEQVVKEAGVNAPTLGE